MQPSACLAPALNSCLDFPLRHAFITLSSLVVSFPTVRGPCFRLDVRRGADGVCRERAGG